MSGSPQNVAPTDEAGIPKQKDRFADFFKLYVLPAPKHSIHVTDLRELIRKVFPKHFGNLSDVTPTVTSAIKSAHKKVKDNLTKNEHEALMADGSDAWLYRSKNGAPCVLYGMDIRKEPTNHMKTTSAYIHIRKYALTCLLDDMDVTFEKIKQEREDAEEAAKDNKKTTTKPNTESKTKVKADTNSLPNICLDLLETLPDGCRPSSVTGVLLRDDYNPLNAFRNEGKRTRLCVALYFVWEGEFYCTEPVTVADKGPVEYKNWYMNEFLAQVVDLNQFPLTMTDTHGVRQTGACWW